MEKILRNSKILTISMENIFQIYEEIFSNFFIFKLYIKIFDLN